MNTQKEEITLFPSKSIKISLIIAALLLAIGGLIMKNQAFFNSNCAVFAASMGNYKLAQGFISGIDGETEKRYYNDAIYNVANAMMERGDYDLALEKFRGLGDYSDSKDKCSECVQKKAKAYINDGDYRSASELLKDILFFEGSKELYQECQYRSAVEQIEKGEWLIGVKILWGIKDYRDSLSIAEKAMKENTGNSDLQSVVGSGNVIDPEIMEDYLILTENRSRLKDGSVAVGFFHTVGLKNDGTVLSCGNNEQSQCDTNSWKNVIQIAAGAYHTVGLLRDGTVIACGDNSFGQCDVSDWKNVVQIKATDYNTVGLLKDGTVLTCGFNQLTKAKGWSGIDRLCTGSYAVCGINRSGELMVTHPSCQMQGDFVDVDMSITYAIGLTYSGEVVYSSETPCKWKKAVGVYAGGDKVAVIDQRFKPSVYDRRKGAFSDLPNKKAVSIALGGTHFAVMYDDGSVYCTGSNDAGQCDTSGWNLN